MAGSFEIFRKYQRSLLVCVAILAMLAFFVLPPFSRWAAPSVDRTPWPCRGRGATFGKAASNGRLRSGRSSTGF